MAKYTQILYQNVVYSLGDTHGQGSGMMSFIRELEAYSQRRGDRSPAFVQLGDLCDAFSFPQDDSDASLRREIGLRISRYSALRDAFYEGRPLVDWRLDSPGDRYKGSVRGLVTGLELLERGERDQLVALYQACKCFETLELYASFQKTHPTTFYVVLGNHDADLLRGQCRYGRQQKYILLGLLGFTPDEVIAHMTKGASSVILRSPYMDWLSARPHLVLSRDTAYMHGGPTGKLDEKLGASPRAFRRWVRATDLARQTDQPWLHPAFREHESFLSPDKPSDDWIRYPQIVSRFCRAARIRFLSVGHSPFLDYHKGRMIDLKSVSDEEKTLFRTPAALPPQGCLIKQDTNLKRVGMFWACRHQTGTDSWTAICVDQMCEVPLRGRGNVTSSNRPLVW